MKNTTSENFLLSSNLPFDKIGEGIKRQIMGYDHSLMVVKVYFDKGASAEAHSHSTHSQSTYIALGRFEIMVGDQIVVLDQGDGFFVPPGTIHNATCLDEGILIDTFSPCRLEFLE